MKRNILISLSFLLVGFSFLFFENLEGENTTRLKFAETNLPSQVNQTVGGLFNFRHVNAVDYKGIALSFFMTADAGSCSWGNMGMQYLSSEPLTAFVKNPAYPNPSAFEDTTMECIQH